MPKQTKTTVKKTIKSAPKKSASVQKLATKKTADSTFYYANKSYIAGLKGMAAQNKPEMDKQFSIQDKAAADKNRQSLKGKPGYDANGFLLKKKK